ncbi:MULTISPECIES: SRPBCC family protein [unclassified Gordonia (in: high G+C Gram-positive bacteria)]|uniref:SRPBCC family protein n=1 Tax=unclassified Gordonia (in: high G+C Gram-positive bacteria) TaxID=2657482 RepID=UPI0009AD6BFA|nr:MULTISPECIES: SRPBCC family protein [unclassified Gordonia (in: high G+C Gram-positive bacteria)]MDF3281159.1 SRPBCC family protein [Gordonia sp. N1V]OPX16962.1 polyketide cyclase [Gordonia sp. i37]
MRSRHVSHVIAASPDQVYEFASDPGNLALWASGLAQAPVTRRGGDLLVESPMGTVTVRFVPPNEFGVIDHDVTLPSGSTVTNPVRVLAHPDGSEVVFTLRQLDLTDEEFDRDAATVAADLARLADLVEQSGPKSG